MLEMVEGNSGRNRMKRHDELNSFITIMSDSKNNPKGILKKTRQPSRDKSKSATFDEMNVIATLHPAEKDYGYMKVDEPPTPYNYEYEEGQKEVLDPNVLAAKLAESVNEPLKSKTKELPTEDELTSEEKKRRKVFQEKRKAHYNEYYAAKLNKVDSLPDEVNIVTPTPGPSRSPNLTYCKDFPNCPGHKPGSSEKCVSSKVKGKMGTGTVRKTAGPSNK